MGHKTMQTLRCLLLACVAVACSARALVKVADHPFTNCGTDADPVKVGSIDLNPDPVQPGQSLTISINATIDQTAGSGHNMTGGKISVQVLAFGVPVIPAENLPICQCVVGANTCPLKDGQVTLKQSFDIPSQAPPISVTVKARSYDVAGDQTSCSQLQ